MDSALRISKKGEIIGGLLPILETAKFDGILHLKSIKKQGRSGRMGPGQIDVRKGIGTVTLTIF